MKLTKYLAIALLLLCSRFSSHAAEYALYEDWSTCADGKLPEGWTTTATDKTPSGYAASFFEYGEGVKVMELPGSTLPYAVSYSTTLEGGKVDTRLISPTFTVPTAGAILSFSAVNYNPEGSVANKIEVLVAEEDSKEESILIARIPSNSVSNPANYNLSLGAYAGKELSLVIANEGTAAGLLGIGSILVTEYVGEFIDTTPLFTSTEENHKLSMAVRLLAPCKGFSATLTTSTGIEETYTSNKDLSEALNLYTLPFKSTFSLKKGEVMEYTVSVTPNMEGATPLVLTGSTGCGDGFPMVCVEEEGTGEKCGYCPGGAAGIEKFSNEYGNRFIGIGIHCTSAFSTGVMESPTYAEPFVNNPYFPIVSLPSAILNRKISQSPTYFDDMDTAVAKITEETSVAETQINSVVYDEDTHTVKVRFSTRLALPLVGTDLKAAVVLLADSLTGSDIKWWQYDYYSGTSKEDFLKQANESWWEYMKFYCEYPAELISPTDMTFNHVAMGIYPDFFGNGCPLRSDWTDGAVDESEISFVMPMQEVADGFGVQNPANTSVVALIFNGRTGEIIAADKAHASTYEVTGIESIQEDAAPLRSYFIDMNGVHHAVAPKGVSIKVTEYSDGTIRTEKILTH
ncbi:MAG: hypothetical protein HDR88_08105 [Bacteroides sp.]|nr:hypothetical protein [Bacteroides sp.]